MWGNAWRRNLGALWAAQVLNMVAWSFFFPFIPLFIQTLNVHGTVEAAQWSGAISAVPSLTMAVSQPLWGRMADRWGRKPMVIRSLIVNAILTLIMGFATSAEQLLILRTVQGLGTGTIAAITALVATSMPRDRVGFGLGVMQVAVFVGASVGPLIGGVIADLYGYRAAFYAAAAMGVLSVPIVALLVEERFSPAPRESAARSLVADTRSLLAISLFPLLIGVIFLIQFANFVVGPFISLYIQELSAGENTATSAGLVLGAMGMASAISALTLGRIGDRVGHAVVLPVCLVGVALSYFPQALVREVWQLLLLRVATGLFLGGLMPSANALVASVIPRHRRGTAFGLTSSATCLSHAVGPVFGAAVATTWGMRAVFLATGIAFAAAFGWAYAGFRKAGSGPPRSELTKGGPKSII